MSISLLSARYIVVVLILISLPWLGLTEDSKTTDLVWAVGMLEL